MPQRLYNRGCDSTRVFGHLGAKEERAKSKRRKRPQMLTRGSGQFLLNFPLFLKDKYFNSRQSGSRGTTAGAKTLAYERTSKHPLLKLHRKRIAKRSLQATMFTLEQLTHGTLPALLLSLALSLGLSHTRSSGRLRGAPLR